MTINKISGNYASDLVFSWEKGNFTTQQLAVIADHSSSLFDENENQFCVLNIFELQKLAALIPEFGKLYDNERIKWTGKRFDFDLTTTPLIFAILNVSPESFYAHESSNLDTFLKDTEAKLAHGAKFLELGGKSTKPHYDNSQITTEQEWERIKRYLVPIKKEFPEAIISIDTDNVEVMRRSLEYGADVWNDITGFKGEGKMELLEAQKPAIIPMFNDRDSKLDDPISSMMDFFKDFLTQTDKIGLPKSSIVLDSGIGYSRNSSSHEDLDKLNAYRDLSQFDCPLLVAISHKSFMSKEIPNCDSLELTLLSELRMIQNGGRVLRVHDIKETQDMLDIFYRTIK